MSALWARIRAAFDDLAPREQLLVGVAAGLLVFALVIFGIVQPVLGASERAGWRLAAAEQELRAVQELRARYDEMNVRLAAVEARIRGGPAGEIFTTLEELARQSAVKIDSMEPRTSPASDEYRETKVQVSLKGVTLAQLVNYLHRIETAPRLLSVKSLRIRTRGDKQELLDVTFTVSSFEPVGS
jgi:type II secretory pathway component PulM